MAELGEDAEKYHIDIGTRAKSIGIENIFSVGEAAQFIQKGAASVGLKNALHFTAMKNVRKRLKMN